jgi:hypothetical protein
MRRLERLLWVATLHLIGSQAALGADVIPDDITRYVDKQTEILKSCQLGSAYKASKYESVTDKRWTVTGWTGGCQEGKRDGTGIITQRWDEIDTAPQKDGDKTGYTWADWQVTFVDGKLVGLICPLKSGAGGPELRATGPGGCWLGGGENDTGYFQRQPDGRSRAVSIMGVPVRPATYALSGALERESARMIAAAKAGEPVGRTSLPVVVPDFGDIVGGGQLRYSPVAKRLDLRNSRVAVVLSAHSTQELARFAQMRQEMIARKESLQKEGPLYREEFIKWSDPKQVMGSVVTGLKSGIKTVIPANDLSVLTSGQADYALIFDWRFAGDFSLSKKDFKSLPRCRDGKPDQCTVLFNQTYTGWLINSKLEVLGAFESGDSFVYQILYDASLYDSSYVDLFRALGRYGFKYQFNMDDGAIWKEVRRWVTGRNGDICPYFTECY